LDITGLVKMSLKKIVSAVREELVSYGTGEDEKNEPWKVA
jgi:hypothetical protein